MKFPRNLHMNLSWLAVAALLSACGGGGGGSTPVVSIDRELSGVLTGQAVLSGTGFTIVIPNVSDQGTLTYTATQANGSPLPAGLTFDPVTRTFTGSSVLDLTSDLSVRVTASNGVSSSTGTFTLAAVPQGVFRTPSQFYGVVFPKSTGLAEMWTWELLDNGVKLWSGDVAYPGNGFSALSSQRTSSGASFSTSANVAAQAGKLANGMRFTVNGSVYDTERLSDAWPGTSPTPGSFDVSDWQGTWEAVGNQTLSGSTVTVRHVWTVNSAGVISGNKFLGSSSIAECTVTGGEDSKVTLTGTPVSRVKVTYSCTDSSSSVYSGISFNRRTDADGSWKQMFLPRTDSSSSEFLGLTFTRMLSPS